LSGAVTDSALQRFAQRAAEASLAAAEKCDLCADIVPHEHRHLLESGTRSVACVCRACAILFASPAASLGKYRLIPDRYLRLDGFGMTDPEWNGLHVPVGICFITGERAFYPGPMGAADAALDPETWRALIDRCAMVVYVEPDLEALLVNRARGARDYFIVPIDTCFSLVGLIRTHWRGLSGGTEVWTEINGFFERLRKRSRTLSMEVAACQSATT
jgi:hypothetical protein